MVRKEAVVDDVVKLMSNQKNIRNLGIVAHVDHGKTTLSDSLLAKAGLISRELAGEQRVLDFDEQEQARGITIKAANISLWFNYENENYIINMIDTPGHVDFGGHVTRAMRMVDGVIVVVDAVEGIMPQTETVLRQALKEKVRPVLFINKIDRLINELNMDYEAMQARFIKIIMGVNKLIEGAGGDKKLYGEWAIKVDKGNVAFGTGFHKWAISYPIMQKKGITFKDLYKFCSEENHKHLQEVAPIEEVILEMAVKHLPDPFTAQKNRIPTIWHGDLESPEGKAMMNCDKNGKVCFMLAAIVMDPHAGEVAVGRVFSGNVTKGTELYSSITKKRQKVQQVGVYMGPDRVQVDSVPCGNIIALIGLKDLTVGETLAEEEIAPFEKIKHHSEPVVTKSIEAKNPRDLAKLIIFLRKLAKEDPTIRVTLNEQTGEHLLSGMGELHLEIIEYKIKNDGKVEIVTSPPIVLYQETIEKECEELEGKSANKHNRFKLYLMPLEAGVAKALNDGDIDPATMKGAALVEALINAGLPRPEAKRLIAIHGNNVFVDVSKGVQYLTEIKENVVNAFVEACDQGPLAKETVTGIKVLLTDATIHVDPIHRGPAQIIPAVRNPIYAGMMKGGAFLLEPKQILTVTAPNDYMGSIVSEIQGRRGQVTTMEQEGDNLLLKAKIPISETFGFASSIRGATQGRAAWYYEYAGYEALPKSLQEKTILSIRKRKGEPQEMPTAEKFLK